MKTILTAVLFALSFSSMANDTRCLQRLGDLISGTATLTETGAKDSKPLRITLSNFNETAATISASGVKDGKTFDLVSGQFSLSNCRITNAGISFRMRAGGKTVNITQTGGSNFRANSSVVWSSEFVLR